MKLLGGTAFCSGCEGATSYDDFMSRAIFLLLLEALACALAASDWGEEERDWGEGVKGQNGGDSGESE